MMSAMLAAACLQASAASFDCAKARSKSERLICSDPQLSALDDRLAALAAAGKKRAASPRAYQRMLDAAWSERQKCQDIACVDNWYARRIDVLSGRQSDNDRVGMRPVLRPQVTEVAPTPAPEPRRNPVPAVQASRTPAPQEPVRRPAAPLPKAEPSLPTTPVAKAAPPVSPPAPVAERRTPDAAPTPPPRPIQPPPVHVAKAEPPVVAPVAKAETPVSTPAPVADKRTPADQPKAPTPPRRIPEAPVAKAKPNVSPGAQLQVISGELGFAIPLTREEFLERYGASGGQCGVSPQLPRLKALSRSAASDCWTGSECRAPTGSLSCKTLRTAYDSTGRLVLFTTALSTTDATTEEGTRELGRLVEKFAEFGGSDVRTSDDKNGRVLTASNSQGQFKVNAVVSATGSGKQIGTFSVATK